MVHSCNHARTDQTMLFNSVDDCDDGADNGDDSDVGGDEVVIVKGVLRSFRLRSTVRGVLRKRSLSHIKLC